MTVNYGKIGDRFFLVGLILICIFLPTSKYMLSVSQFYLLALWMLLGLDMRSINKMFPEKPFFSRLFCRVIVSFAGIWNIIKTRFTAFLHNKVAVIMVSMFLLHIFGLIYTSDFQYAFKDIRIKLPLLLFPIILSSMKPIGRKQFDLVVWLFTASLFFVTILGAIKFIQRDFIDVRELSVFVSHIRVCLCIVFVIFVLAYYLVRRNYIPILKILITALILWFLWYIYIIESFISIILIIALCTALVINCIFKCNNNILRVSALVFLLSSFAMASFYVYKIVKDYYSPEKIVVEDFDTHTKLGNPYIFDTINYGIEDGRYLGLYLSQDEMIKAWNQLGSRKINYEGDDTYWSLVRYLTSKDLRKDADGVSQLTTSDIRNIENGIDNYNYIENPGIKCRIMKILVALETYQATHNANGSSVFQRVEYIKASLNLIKKHPVFGIGTGDLNNAFADYYEETNSNLLPEYRLRSHNQYLAITIAFGLLGLLFFLFTLLYPYCSDKRYRNYFYSVFLLIMILSMFTEDTIESQIGVTIFAFFNSFLVFTSPYSQDDPEEMESLSRECK